MYASCSEYVSNITKRTLLSDVSKHFDPIGLIAPVLVVAKVIIQSCCKLDLEWNDAVPDDVSRAYTNWKDDISSLSQLKIPRKVLPTHLYDEASLQVFCDAATGQTKKLKISKKDLDYAYGQKAISEKRGLPLRICHNWRKIQR